MLQLVNLSNYRSDLELIHHEETCLSAFLQSHQLDGVEMMFCDGWNRDLHKKEYIHGAHLKFWPCWLDFWQGNQMNLLVDFGSEENIRACYDAATREEWLAIYRKNINVAIEAGAAYLVFHVGHVRPAELFTWEFEVSNQEVIAATCDLINELCIDIPKTITLLFENLWWPGLTLQDPRLADDLLSRINHRNTGIMLDTGHLMNTNQNLKTESEGIEYVLGILNHLGDIKKSIRGIHLHKSLSGDYVKKTRQQPQRTHNLTEIMTHVLKIDQHLPFESSAVCKIIDLVQPDYLVHEFMQTSMDDWHQKVKQQKELLIKFNQQVSYRVVG